MATKHKCVIPEHICKQTTDTIRFFMSFVKLTDGRPHIVCWPLEHNSIILKRIEDPHVLELSRDKYLVKNLIVQAMQVIHAMIWPEMGFLDMMYDPMKLPGYHEEDFPFVVVRRKIESF